MLYSLALDRSPEECPAAGAHLAAVVRVLAGLLAADVAQPNGVVAAACRLGLGGPPGRRGRR